jgi:hypothetical protein
MDMYSRNQYLQKLREEYLGAERKQKTCLLNEAEKRTSLARKHLIKKLKVTTNFNKKERKKREEFYDGDTKVALICCWNIFDYPCGQRLAPLLETEVDRLRKDGELICSDKTAEKLKRISPKTCDRKLAREKEVEFLKRKYHKKVHPLLYRKIPVKLSDEWNRKKLGNIQLDLVEHCGQSASGEYIYTLSNADIASGWWEGEAILGRGQKRTVCALDKARSRSPFAWQEIHPDNETSFINWHLFEYAQRKGLSFSRSRPNKKNDNCFIEQKNWTHVRKFVGYYRYDTPAELDILNDLYRGELRLYKNFFQPVMKLIKKERIGGKIKRRYDKARTPYHRLMESEEVSDQVKQELKQIYDSLNPAELKRTIDMKLDKLYAVYKEQKTSPKVNQHKKLKPVSVTYLMTHRDKVRLPN